MPKLKLIVLLALVTALPIIAARTLPWWGTVVVIGVVIIAVLSLTPAIIGEILQDHMTRLFKEKARVLASARADVGTVEPVDRPAGVDRADNVSYVRVDVTISPEVAGMYDPADIALVPLESDVNDHEASYPAANSVRVYRIEADGGEHQTEQVSGRQRLRITYEIPEELRGAVKFRYYYSDFGRLDLP